MLVERSARAVAARLADDYLVLVHPRRGRDAVERWMLTDGDGVSLAEAAKRSGWACEGKGCRATVRGKKMIWLDPEAAPPPDCRSAQIVVSAKPLRRACGRSGEGRVVIDRFDVWRHGAHAIHVDDDETLRVVTARALQGDRPWTYALVARRQVLAPPDALGALGEQGPTDASTADEADTSAADGADCAYAGNDAATQYRRMRPASVPCTRT